MKNNKNNKERLFEMMSKIDNTFKQKLNESDNYNYPAGADANPNAPWHQGGNDLSNIEPLFDRRYPDTFEIRVTNDSNGYKYYDGFELLGNTNDPELHQYFDRFIDGGLSYDIMQSPEFIEKVTELFNKTVGDANVEWEYPEDDSKEYNKDNELDEV